MRRSHEELRLGHMRGWNVGPRADQEVFRLQEYRDHAR